MFNVGIVQSRQRPNVRDVIVQQSTSTNQRELPHRACRAIRMGGRQLIFDRIEGQTPGVFTESKGINDSVFIKQMGSATVVTP
jgi:hypothetical protein